MSDTPDRGLPRLEYHVLLALASDTLYGYAITEAIADESRGAVRPRAGTLYRVLARLVASGLIEERNGDASETHPGRARRWYGLTPTGRQALTEESSRISEVAELARRRLGIGRP